MMVILLCVLSQSVLAASTETLVIDDSVGQMVPARSAAFWVETQPTLPEQVFAMDASEWQPVKYASISAGLLLSPVWYRVQLHNAEAREIQRLIEQRWINFDSLDMYLRRSETVEHQFAGINDQGIQVRLTYHSMVMSVTFAPGEKVDLFIRMNSRYFSFAPLFVWQPEQFQAHRESTYQWYFLGFGALCALFLYNLSLCVLLRDSTYLLYCCYTVGVIVYELAFSGIGNYFFWGESAWMQRNALGLGVYTSFLAGTLFMRQYLNVSQYSVWLVRLIDVSILYWLVALITLFALDQFFRSSIALSVICCVAAIAIAFYLWYRGNPSAKFYLAAWGALLVFTTGTILRMTGAIPYHWLTEHGQMIGFVMEMLLLSFALAARINQERNQREQAQQEALQLQLDISQERDNTIQAQQQILELEKHQKHMLETRVAERTQALQHAMEELAQANMQLAHLTVTDALTGVANRRYFDEALTREFRRAERNGEALSLILIDIDHFKQLNDIHGHLAGDECLRQFAALLQKTLPRATDLVARYGGEEFAVILPGTPQDAAFLVAEKIRLATQDMAFSYKQQRVPVTVSLGVAGFCPTATSDPSELVDAADNALYLAKNRGRNRCVAATES